MLSSYDVAVDQCLDKSIQCLSFLVFFFNLLYDYDSRKHFNTFVSFPDQAIPLEQEHSHRGCGGAAPHNTFSTPLVAEPDWWQSKLEHNESLPYREIWFEVGLLLRKIDAGTRGGSRDRL